MKPITPLKLFLLLGCLLAAAAAPAQTVAPCVTINCPSNLMASCTGTNSVPVDFTVAATTICGESVTVNCVPPSGSLFAAGTTAVNCVAIDSLRNMARCEFSVTVGDTVAPVITAPEQVNVSCSGPGGAFVNYPASVADNCDRAPRFECEPRSGSLFPVGTTVVHCVAVDAAGNRSVAAFPVTVSGGCSADCLQIICPNDLEVALRSGSNRVVTFSVLATNRCGGYAVPVTCQPPSGSPFSIGSTTVLCTATNSGAVQMCSFHVTVKDVSPPKVRGIGQLMVPCQGYDQQLHGGAHVSYPIIALDNTDPSPQVTCEPPSGSWFSLGTNAVTCVVKDASNNAVTNHFNVIVQLGPACEVSAPITELSPENWDFELGLTSWRGTGGALAYQPVLGDIMRVRRIAHLQQQLTTNIGGGYWQDLIYQIGFKGHYWIGTADNYAVPQGVLFDSEQPDETLTGELRSKPFHIAKRYISFLIGGNSEPQKLRVELLAETDPGTPGAIHIGTDYFKVEYSTTGHGRELMRRAAWSTDVSGHQLLGKLAFIRIVDESTTGHLNVDDFQFVDTHPHFQKVKVGDKEYPAVVQFEGLEYDWDSPVWGFVDLHTHPMAHLGFAEAVMHGQPDGGANQPTNVALALGDCNCVHGGKDILHNQCGNYLRQALQMGIDDQGNDSHREGWDTDRITFDGQVNDYGRFRHWPVFTTKTHQQMWYEWLKRAYDGGLRTMVALCVNNALLGSASEGPGPLDDLTVGDHQIRALKEFVARHDDFMEIAYDPFELRDIVRRNKLGVIIGTELDDIGNLARNPDVHAFPFSGETTVDEFSRQAVTNAVYHLYTNGVRYIFPVHLVNNKFGGTPIANLMLNIANRYLNGVALSVEAAEPSDHIHYWLPGDFDLGNIIEDHKEELIAGAVALPLVLPLLPAMADIFSISAGAPPGSGSAIGAGLLPVALLAGVGALPDTLQAIPPNVWPINHHYPAYPGKGPGEAPWGHRNARGLTELGEIAILEIMKHGMMIDVDHMSQKTLKKVFAMAEANPVGYPLNSGHNNFRALVGEESAENNRSAEQMTHLRDLGGLFGVGYENANTASLAEVGLAQRNFSTSDIANDCAGTSKTVGQIYLYALEAMGGHRVGFGTDINGLIAGPGPRFGPNSDFANKSPWQKAERIRSQENGVRYTPKHGTPIVGPTFMGKGVDPDQVIGFGSGEHFDDHGNLKPSYAYSQEQRDFFPAIRIFHYLEGRVSGNGGWSQAQVLAEVITIAQVLDDGYYKPGVIDFSLGLLAGIKGWSYTGFMQRLGKLVYQEEILDSAVPDDIDPGSPEYEQLFALRAVWYDYHQTFGKNPPLIRSKTGPKDWDINFDGVAHYGMLPDLLQDMVNVGLESSDLDPLFHSSDEFASMWTKTLRASDALRHTYLELAPLTDIRAGVLVFQWTAEPGDRLEETYELGQRASWHPFSGEVHYENGQAKVTIRLDPGIPTRFLRVRK
jgi:microsomal dipeptidase-like Zn-dependent dipeptidase